MAVNQNWNRSRAQLNSPFLLASLLPDPAAGKFLDSVSDVIGYGPVIRDTHARRLITTYYLTPSYPPGRFLGYLYYETDRKTLYLSMLVADVPTWVYVAGKMYDLLANIPVDLGTADAGFEFEASDYKHVWRWTGAVWHFADGDASEYCLMGSPRGGAPKGGLWGLCDGSAYNVAQDNATLASVTTQNLTGDVGILGAAAPDGAQRPAAAATWDPAAKTDDESAHTHSVNLAAANSYAAGAFPAYPGGVVSTGPGSAHHHTLSDGVALLNPPSEGDGGLGLRIAAAWYIRR